VLPPSATLAHSYPRIGGCRVDLTQRLKCPALSLVAGNEEKAGKTVRNLEHVVRPKSVAVIGASAREGSVGRVVIGDLSEKGTRAAVVITAGLTRRTQFCWHARPAAS
jgi:hypothetical protein